MTDTTQLLIRRIERLAEIQSRTPDAIARRAGGTGQTYARLRAGAPTNQATISMLSLGVLKLWPEGVDMPQPEDIT